MTQRLRTRIGMGDSDSSDEDEKESGMKFRRKSRKVKDIEEAPEYEDKDSTLRGDGVWETDFAANSQAEPGPEKDDGRVTAASPRGRARNPTTLSRENSTKSHVAGTDETSNPLAKRRGSFQMPRVTAAMTSLSTLEQSMPAE